MTEQDWRTEVLGETVQTDAPEMYEYMSRFKDAGSAVKSGYETHKLNTRKTEELRGELAKEFVPADDWTDEQWEKYAEKMRPKDTSGYNVEVPETVKAAFNDDVVKATVADMHELGIKPWQANRLMNKYIARTAETLKALETEAQRLKTQDTEQLKKDWGKDYQKNTELAKRGMDASAKHSGMDNFVELLKTYGLDTHPAFQRFFNWIGIEFGDPDISNDNPPANTDKEKEKTQYQKNKERWPNSPEMWGPEDK